MYFKMSEKELRIRVLAPHPGEILKGLLDNHEMSQRDLAAAIGKTTPVVNDIISRKRDVNVEIAVLLEAYFDEMKAIDWLVIQSRFDIELAQLTEKVKEQKQSISDWKSLEGDISLRVIKKRAGLGISIQKDLAYICKLYRQDSVSNLRQQLAHTRERACFKKSEAHSLDARNLNTWLLLTRIANDKFRSPVAPFLLSRIEELIAKLNDIFYANKNTLSQVEHLLPQYGIKFFVEKKLDKVPVDGYSFWDGDNPTIVVTTRYSWLDNLAFTIFHELGHIVKHLSVNKDRDFLDTTEGNSDVSRVQEENEANEYATKCLWRNADMHAMFKKIINPFASSPILKKIASHFQINEGIVVAQYQHYCSTKLEFSGAYAVAIKLRQKIR